MIVKPRGKFSALPSGNYTAVDNGDGTSDILDIPILSEMKKGWKGAPEDLGRDWLQKLVDNHQRLALQDRHLKPVHIQHHELFVRPERAGFLMPTRVGRMNLGGRDLWTAFADLKNVPNVVVSAIENMKLPYVSVEVRSWKDALLSSLALMDTDDPFWQYPMLTIGRRVEKSEFVRHGDPGPVMATLCVEDGSGAILLSFRGGKMGDETNDRGDEKDPKDTERKPGNEQKPEDKLGMIAEQLSNLSASMQAMLAGMNKLVGGLTPPGSPNAAKAPFDQAAPAGAMPANGARMSAKEDADFDQLKSTVERLDKREKVAELVAGAKKKLEGWHLGERAIESIKLHAEADLTGKQLDRYVEDYKAMVQKDPPSKFNDGARGGSNSTGEYSAAVLKYSSEGPDSLREASELEAEHKAATLRGHAGAITVERWIELGKMQRRQAEKRA